MAGRGLTGSLAAEGRAMRRALIREFLSVEGVEVIATLDMRFEEKSPIAQSVAVGPDEEEETLARLSSECDFTLVIAPETDDILATRTEIVERVGRSLGSTPQAIRLTADKWRLAAHLEVAGIPTPRTLRFRTSDGLPAYAHYPAVIKPVDGAGSIQTYFCENADALPDRLSLPSEMVIQPFLEGESWSVSLLMGDGNDPLILGAGRQNIVRLGNSFEYRGGLIKAFSTRSVAEPMQAVKSVEGLRGWVGVDFIKGRHDESLTVLEINPRPTTSIVGLLEYYEPGTIARAWMDLRSGIRSYPTSKKRKRGLSFSRDGVTLDWEG